MSTRPIAVLSFDRPTYLREVLISLRNQKPTVNPEDIHLFQDGYISKSGRDITNPELVEKCLRTFSEIFPEGKTHFAEKNVGVAFNFDRAERFLFEELHSETGIFFEDDLVLSPFYLKALNGLIDIAAEDKRVGYVAAYGDHHLSLPAQEHSKHHLTLMRHKWGFALFKRQWVAQSYLLQPYLDIISENDYKSRNHDAIRSYYKRIGYGSPGTSQDAMKDVASALLGTTKVMSMACYGKNIGKVGLHSTEEFYHSAGFDRTVMYPEPVTFDALREDQVTSWVDEGRRAALEAV